MPLVFLLTIVNASYSDNYSPVRLSEKRNLVSLFNKYRRSVGSSNMNAVSWNNTCEQKLQEIADKYSKDWFFEKNNNTRLPGMAQQNAFNIEFLNTMPEFNKTCPGWIFLDRDTYRNNANPMTQIFKFRENQASCCNMNKCNKTAFTNYQSCCFTSIGTSKKCSSAFHYYPRHYISSLDQIAGIILNRRGPFTPNPRIQKYVYFLYGRFNHDMTTDMPYKKGPACSECDSEHPQCSNKLCISN